MSSDTEVGVPPGHPPHPVRPGRTRSVGPAATTTAAAVPGHRMQRGRLARRVALGDLTAVALVAAVAAATGVVRLGWTPLDTVAIAGASVVLVALGLALTGSWDRRVVVEGPGEIARLVRVFVVCSLALALAGIALKVDAVRPWVFGVLPITGLTVVLWRRTVRAAIHRGRRAGRYRVPVLVVGTPTTATDIAVRARRAPQHGWTVVGACTPGGAADRVPGVPVVGDLDDVAARVVDTGAEVVAVAPAPGWTRRRLHQLAWEIEGHDVDLVVDAGLMEIAEPRLRIAPVDGLPLLRLSPPRFTGLARASKVAFDRSVALVSLLLLAPVLVALAIAVASDGGPVFYRQERVGLAGRPFGMIKFRSMVPDADRLVSRLANEAAGPLFKMRTDPRVTRVGRLLRRYSLDELPQLFNVLGGSMSLVGPRPPLAREVAEFEADSLRRLLVRPGMTGIWQVSGRSDLPWDESVRLDLGYVENWSPWMDLSILARTARAVVGGRGAY